MKIKQAVKQYDKAIWNLAKAMMEIRSTHSRNALLEIVPFNKSKIELFLKLGCLQKQPYENLTPEHYMEVLNESPANQAKFLRQASEEGLKPLQMRKLIRKANKTVITKDKNVSVNDWNKHLIMLNNSLKSMEPAIKDRALAHIAQLCLPNNTTKPS